MSRVENTIIQAFWGALLLTGSVEDGESAVLEAIESYDCEEPIERTLLWQVARVCLERRERFLISSTKIQSLLESAVPSEFRAVLNLSETLRRCFVLCVLMRLPLDSCTSLLKMNRDESNEHLGRAYCELSPGRMQIDSAIA